MGAPASVTSGLDADRLDASASSYAAYPPLLDAALQALVALLTANASPDGETILPASIGRLERVEPIPLDEPAHRARVARGDRGHRGAGSFRLLAADGRLVAEAADVMLARVRPADSGPLAELLYDPTWRPTTLEAGAVSLRVLLIASTTTRRRAALAAAAALRVVGTEVGRATRRAVLAVRGADGDAGAVPSCTSSRSARRRQTTAPEVRPRGSSSATACSSWYGRSKMRARRPDRASGW